jgi:5-methylcytosine-specific restriction endonuclease McrA
MKYGEQVVQNSKLKKKLSELKIPIHRYLSRHHYGIWDADHVVPVVEGGGESTLENYRTLCCRCHGEETAKLRKRRAKKRSLGSS